MKVCVVSGVTREMGLGYAIARKMQRLGYAVCLGGRSVENAQDLARRMDKEGAAVHALALDVTDDESVEAFFTFVESRYGVLDALINNAGGNFDAGVQPLDVDFAEARMAFETNLFGAWRMVRRAVPLLKNSEAPCVVNVSSGAGSFSDEIFGLANSPAIVPAYGLSKLALNGLTVKLSKQLAGSGLRVNSVDPGLVATYPGMEKMGAVDPMVAANGVVWAATLAKDGPTGQFFRDGKRVGW